VDELFAAAAATTAVLKNVLPSLFVGLFLAGLFARRGLAGGRRALALIARLTGLPPAATLSVVLALGDRTAGMAAVEAARRRAGLTDGEVIAANLVAKAPSVLQFFFFSFIPVMAALYPPAIAARFLAVYFAGFVLISLIGVGLARFGRRGRPAAAADFAGGAASWPEAALGALADVWRPLLNMAGWMAAMTFLVMLFIQSGYPGHLNACLPLLARLGLDASVLSLAGAGLVSMIGGAAAVGGALAAGAVPAAVVVPLLLVISLLHNLYDLFASSLPRAIGVFGRRLGIKVALAGFAVTQAVMAIMLVLTLKGYV